MFKSQRIEEVEVRSGGLSDDFGKLILRLTIAGLMLFHGVAKLKGGVGGIAGMLENEGLPTFIAYGVYVGEVVVPVLMILGILTRLSALVFAFNMVVAIYLAHRSDVLALGEHGEWAIELQLLYLLPAIAIVFLGPGRFALWKRTGLFA
ncbi:MAG: DoxX family protein [Planctomycetota bacterium]